MKPFLFFVLVSLSFSLPAATIYCAPSGNDNSGNGSLASPYKTVAKAVSMANAGDVVELRQGNYVSNELRISINNLTIRSYNGEKATLTCPTNVENYASCIWYDEPEVTGGLLENLEIVGGYYYGIKLESNWDWGLPANQRRGVKDVTIKGCNIHHTGRDCIKLTPGCENINIVSCEIHHSGVGMSNDPNNPNAEGIDNVNSQMWVHNCYFHDISTSGLYAKGGATNCIVEENLVMDTGEGGILIGFYTDAEWFNEVTNPDYYEAIGCIVRNNIIVNTGGAGLGFWGSKNCIAYNNTVVTASSKFHSPLFFDQGDIWLSATVVKNPKNLNVTLKNNLFVDLSPDGDEDYTVEVRENSLTGTTVMDNNLYYKSAGSAKFTDGVVWPAIGLSQWKSLMGIDTNSLEANPQLNSQHHLQSGSPCIDAGVNLPTVSRDYDGNPRSNHDIGADEFNAGIALTTPPPTGITGTGATPQTTGIQSDEVINFKLYPNPCKENLFVCLPNSLPSQPHISLFDLQGKSYAASFTAQSETMYVLETAKLPIGIYLLQINGQSRLFLKGE